MPQTERKIALITGAARRLGAAIARDLAADGCDLVLHCNGSRDDANALQHELEGSGARAWVLSADLAVPGAATQLFADARAAAGPIDYLINNASIFPESTLGTFTAADLTLNMQVNALAPLELARALHAQGRPGVIINLLDTRVNDYDKNHVAYHLSKRTLDALTRMMASDYAPAIRVNAIAPGLILPPEGKDESYLAALAHTNPLQAHGGPKDITDAVRYLLHAEFTTGQTLYIDGGRHLRGNFYGN